MKNLKMKAAAAVALAAGAITVPVVTAQAYAGDYIYNICYSQTGITVLRSDNYRVRVDPCNASPNNIQGFYVDTCYKAKNVDTGYVYAAGYHPFAYGNAHINLQHYYQGWC